MIQEISKHKGAPTRLQLLIQVHESLFTIVKNRMFTFVK